MRRLTKLFTLLLSLLLVSCNKKEAYNSYLYVGTYTDGTSKGINVYKLNTENGDTKFVEEIEVTDPSYLSVNQEKNMLYAVTEGDSLTSKLSTYSINPQNGYLTLESSINAGDGPCFVDIDQTDKLGVMANYAGGSMSVFSINADGIPHIEYTVKYEGNGIDTIRQSQSHVHSTNISPDGTALYTADLGTDKIYKYSLGLACDSLYIDKDSKKDFDVLAGSGPRHIAFHPTLNIMYLITELSGDVIVFRIDENGDLHQQQTVKADKANGQGSADIHITPDGKYLYASNRLKNDGVAIFEINQLNGELMEVGYQNTGNHPRNFMITPNGKLLLVANKDSNNIQIFEIKEDGHLIDTKKEIKISHPVCLKLYVTDTDIYKK